MIAKPVCVRPIQSVCASPYFSEEICYYTDTPREQKSQRTAKAAKQED